LELASVLMNLQTTGTVTVSHSPTSPSTILTPRPVLLVPAPLHAPLFARIVCVWLVPCPWMQYCRAGPHSQLPPLICAHTPTQFDVSPPTVLPVIDCLGIGRSPLSRRPSARPSESVCKPGGSSPSRLFLAMWVP
jgi:hypothetical protein